MADRPNLDDVRAQRHNQPRQQSLMEPAARTKGASWQGSRAQCSPTGYVSLQLVADSRISVDDARLRPHLRERARLEERTRLEHQQQAIFRNQHAEALAQGRDTSMPTRSTAGGDKRKLRGIPVQARGVGSVQPGTQPEQQATRGQDDTPDDIATFLLHANARRRAA